MNLCILVPLQMHQVTLYYTHNKALLAYDTSLQKQKNKDAEQYHIKVPEYRAPRYLLSKKTLLMC